MTLALVNLPVCLGCDTIFVFDDASAAHLKAQTWQGDPLEYIWRYGPEFKIAERDSLFRAGFRVLLAWHVPEPGWIATAELGRKHGAAQVAHAKSVGWLPGADCLIDMEGVGDPGPNAVAYVAARGDALHAAGLGAVYYEGYQDGLTSPAERAQLVADGHIDKFMSDFGTHTPPPGIGWACVQHPQTMVGGYEIDPDRAQPDLRGVVLVAMGDVEIVDTEPAPDPHVDPSGTTA